MSTDIVIVAAARTAVGKFGGTLAKTPAPELGAAVIAELLERAKLTRRPDRRSDPRPGAARPASGQNPARQAVIKSGLPQSVPALTINAVCGSGLKAVMLAAQAIRDGDSEIVHRRRPGEHEPGAARAAGSRDGQRMGDWKLVDSMIVDGLWDVYNQYHMGITAENVAKKYGITPREAGRARARPRSRRPRRRRKPAASRTRSCRSRSRRRRATRSSSPPTSSSTRRPAPKRWPACARRSTRPAA